MFRVPFSDAALDVRMERVEVPLPIWPPLLPQKIQGESQSRIVPVPQRRDEIEADEEIIVVMDRVVEPVPRRVLSTLLVQFLPQVVLGPEFDGAYHYLLTYICLIYYDSSLTCTRISYTISYQ